MFLGAAELARPLFEGVPENGASGDLFPRLHGLHWLCTNLSTRAPILIAVDDAQWADHPSLEFLSYLAARLGELPVCLAVGIRSNETESGTRLSEALAREGAELPTPAPLGERPAAALLKEELGDGIDPALTGECVRTTGGNALFLKELARSLAELGQDKPSASDIERLTPPSVSRMITDRVGALAEKDAEVARAVAILGDGADLELVELLSGVPAALVGPAVDRLGEIGVLDRDQPLSFVHPIVRRAIYESIPPSRLRSVSPPRSRSRPRPRGGRRRACSCSPSLCAVADPLLRTHRPSL